MTVDAGATVRTCQPGAMPQRARIGTLARRIAWTLVFVVLVVGVVGVLLPAVLFNTTSRWWHLDVGNGRYLGGTLIAAGVLLYVACVVHLTMRGNGVPMPGNPARQLIRTGPFRIVRNPMYLAGILFFWGLFLISGSMILMAYALVAGLVYYPLLIRFEERDLTARFGEEYRQYCETTPRWLPRLPSRRSNRS
jgi:protein-S-isoprenylcysteine O-methyltransferase Ste14